MAPAAALTARQCAAIIAFQSISGHPPARPVLCGAFGVAYSLSLPSLALPKSERPLGGQARRLPKEALTVGDRPLALENI